LVTLLFLLRLEVCAATIFVEKILTGFVLYFFITFCGYC